MSLSDKLGLPPSDGEFVASIDITLRELLVVMAAKQMTHVVIPIDPPTASEALHLSITVARPSQSRAITHAVVGIMGGKR